MCDAITEHNLSPKWFKSISKINRSFRNLPNLLHLNRIAILTWSPERPYHSIMESAVCQKFEFSNISDAKKIMNQFRDFYNFERIHGGINFQSPAEFLLQKGIDMKNSPINRVPVL